MNLHGNRLSNLRAAMIDGGIDTVILTPGAGMRYLTGFSEEGFERLLCLIVPSDHDWLFVTPAVNADHVKSNPAGVNDIRVWTDDSGWDSLLSEIANEIGLAVGTVAVDENMGARFLLPLMEIICTGAPFQSAGPVLSELRRRKDAGELSSLQRAADVTDSAYLVGLEACRIGATEIDIARAIEEKIFADGGKLSFETIVAAGSNGALPHHSPTTRALAAGDAVVLDLGARIDGYCGDITRVVSMGPPSVELVHVYDVVRRAQQAGVDAARPGVTAASVDAAARAVIVDAGYGERFIHRTGHGIGLDDHEQPNIVSTNDHILEPGECFSIEPGIYLPGCFGVRLENIVTVTESGVRVLNAPIPETIAVK